MPWSERLREWALGPGERRAGSAAAAPELAILAARLCRQAEQLESHADLAPNEHADRELRRLAADLRGAAGRLREALSKRGMAESNGTPAAAAAAAGSHWARLVQDLDDLRAIRAHLVDLTAVVDERESDLVAVIAEMIHTAEAQLAGLRGLIARADPQALN